ncbi:AfsR/SARP family transcriptional regulator [Streptomyces malaysiensis]|uniref:NB-ARC domain-containing protein n=1 Tax=Streptomyces autolyticus TaxID=75293 RepID=A0ABN4WFV2_9ACTN|nr:NB-ARC domain-containing protein [Streptomyces autolyticus]AQA14852.1 hypothetical protein BV401_35005 [Streptomyces autolyticus]
MEVQLLGPVQVFRNGAPVLVGAGSQVALLALLILSDGRQATHEELAGVLWPGEQLDGPKRATRLRKMMSRLRSALSDAVVPTNAKQFCRLVLPDDASDALRFRRGVTEAGRLSGEKRAVKFEAALGEWRSDRPLSGLPTGFAALDDLRGGLLDELRNAWNAYIETAVECGRAEFMLERIAVGSLVWPDVRTGFEVHARALLGAGRHRDFDDLVERWERAHGPVRDELSFHRVISAGSSSRVLSASSPVPRQLPKCREEIFGRQFEKGLLDGILLGDSDDVRPVVVSGMPGVGKSELVHWWAKQNASAFDGVLHVNLNGFAQRAGKRRESPEVILGRFLNDLGVEPRSPTLDGRVTTYRTELAGRRMLVILDNAFDVEQVLPLLPGASSSRVVITSRNRMHEILTRFQGHDVVLDPLGHADAAALMTSGFSPDHRTVAARHIDELLAACAGLPLALCLLGARIRMRRPGFLESVVGDIREQCTVLDSLEVPHGTGVRWTIAGSAEALSRDAHRLLWQLSVHPGPTISWTAVVDLIGGDRALAVRASDELVTTSLLQELGEDRFALHDLVREYAYEIAEDQPDAERHRTLVRSLDHLLHNAALCDEKLAPDRQLPVGEPGDCELVKPASAQAAMDWFAAEYATLTAAVRRADEKRMPWHVWLLPMVMMNFQWRTNRYPEARTSLELAARAATEVAEPAHQAMVHRMLGGTHRGLGSMEQAKGHLRRAIALSREHGDRLGLGHGRLALGILEQETGEHAAGADSLRAAMRIYQEHGDPLGEAAALNGLGAIRFADGDAAGARRLCGEALEIFERTSDVNSQASVLHHLGTIALAEKNHPLAIASFTKAADHYQRLKYVKREARTRTVLADVLIDSGEVAEAARALRRAVVLLRELKAPEAGEVDERLRGLK